MTPETQHIATTIIATIDAALLRTQMVQSRLHVLESAVRDVRTDTDRHCLSGTMTSLRLDTTLANDILREAREELRKLDTDG